MKMLAKVILITSLTLQAISSCSLGCLACNEKQNCILCDFKNGYYFKDFKCLKTNIDKCSAIDLNGNCLLCLPHYFLDTSNNNCRPINKELQQVQCLEYSSANVCLTCSGNYYPLNGKCTVLPSGNQVSNCLSYQGLGECSSCSSGYLPNYLGSSCVPNSSSQNCLLRTNIQCSSCPTDYMQNKDYLRINIQQALKSLSQAQTVSDINTYQENIQKGFDILIKQRILVQDNCLKKTVSNCAQFEKFDKCLVCQTGFYLENSQCVAQPKQAIPFCMIYKNLNECNTCIQGYYAETSLKCSPVKVIENCDVYDGSKTQTICKICNRNYYLQEDINTCQKRLNFVDLCEEYELQQDRCKKCQNTDVNYFLTTDKLKCYQEIFKCSQYENSTIDTVAVKCLACQEEYYWSIFENKCVLGTVGFCRLYETNQDNCIECINGYYLQLNEDGVEKCVPHYKQQGCLTYNNRSVDECAVCEEGYIMLTKQTQCISVNIEGCQSYASQTECATCANGYDLSNGICIQLSESSNCVRSVDGKCQQCSSSFQQISGQCYPGFEYQQQHCFNSQLDGMNNYNGHTCNICQKYSIPFNQKNHYVCISNKQLEIFYQYNLYSSYCDSYTLNNLGNLICNSCREGYIFKNNDCIEKCDVDQTSVDDFLIVQDQQLVYKKHKSCFGDILGRNEFADKYGQDENFDGNYSPLNFMSSKAFKTDHAVSQQITIATQKNVPFGKAVSPSLYVFPKLTTIINADLQNKCYLYQNNPNSVESCATCQFGHFGIIDNWYVPNCHTYNQQQCIKCVYGMIPALDGLSCVKHTDITGCMRYSSSTDKCLECHSKYYLDYTNQQCLTNTVDNCLYPQQFQNKCWKCQKGFILNTDSTKCYQEIDNCKDYDLTGVSTVCLLCKYNYYLSNNQCQHIPDQYCWFWESGAPGNYTNGIGTKKCLFYSNVVEVTSIDQCSPIQTVLHCIDYENTDTCVHCKNDHYLIDGHCCAYGKYPLTNDALNAECTGDDVNNCMTYQKNISNEYDCNKCDYLYHLTSVPTTQGQCCQYGYFWQNLFDGVNDTDVGNGSCEKVLDYDNIKRNTPNCKLFSNDQQNCNVCLNDHYFSHGHCCPNGEYWNSTNSTCQSIEDDKNVTNCQEWSDIEANKCQLCDIFITRRLNEIDDFIAPNRILAGEERHITNQCCEPSQYLDVDPADDNKLICVNIPAGSNCKVYDKDSYCTTCNDGFYKSEAIQKVCCQYDNNKFYNPQTEACETPTTLVSDCAKYSSNQECIECFSDGDESNSYWLNPQKTCCEYQTFWDGTHCQGIESSHIYDCWKVEKGAWKTLMDNALLYDYMCSGCKDGVQLLQNTGNSIESESIQCVSINESNCKKVQTNVTNFNTQTCVECNDKFALQYNNDCCAEGKYKKTELATCSDMFTQIKNCFYFDLENFQCKDFSGDNLNTSHSDYDAITFDDQGACAWNIEGLFAFDSADASEPKQCKLPVNFDTPQTGDVNCEIYKPDGSECYQCKKGFQLTAPQTCTDQTKCITNYSNDCINCLPGETETQSAQCATAVDLSSLATKNCSQSNAADDGCLKCYQGYYLTLDTTPDEANNQCCQLGYYYDFTIKICRLIESPYCSKQSNSTINSSTGRADCDQCYISSDLCDTDDTLFFDIENPHYSINISRKRIQNSALFVNAKSKVKYYYYKNVWRDSNKKQCCLNGQFYSLADKKCISLGIDNCIEGTYDEISNSNKCTKCNVGYSLENDICEKIIVENCNSSDTDPVDGTSKLMYVSNQNCCIQGTMWSVLDNKCIPIIDPFCLESQSIGQCSKCKTGYSHSVDQLKQSLPIVNFTFMNFNDLLRCPKIKRNFQYNSCMPDVIVSNANLYTYDKIYLKIKHCGEFDFTTAKKCNKCMSYAYMADSEKGICCIKGEIFVNNLCKKTNQIDVIDQCYSYDIQKKQCLKCKQGYHLQLGSCCALGHYINPFTKKCQYYYPDCANFLEEYSICDKCYPGYYMSNGRCCRYGSRWIQGKQICENYSTPSLYGCQQGASESNCSKCISELLEFQDHKDNIYEGNIYLYNGKCFGYRSFDKAAIDGPETDADISTLRDIVNDNPGMFHCAKVDEYNNCVQCIKNFNLYAHTFVTTRRLADYSGTSTETICCPSGYYYYALTGSGFICESINYSQGCDRMKMNTAGTEVICDTCLSGYYKTSEHCCAENYTWSSEKKICTKLYIEELHNCLENARDSDNECTKCKTGYYLSNEKRCCKDGYYWDTDALNCLNITLLKLSANCNQVLKDGNLYKCSQCTTTTQIYNSTTNTCVVKVGNNAVDQNCKVKTSATGGDNCTLCATNSYKSIATQKPCCPEGQYFNETNGVCESLSTSTIVSGSYQNCKTLTYTAFADSSTHNCKCLSNHYKVGTTNELCTTVDFTATIADNCAIDQATGGNCALCLFGFHINSGDLTACVNTFIDSYGENKAQCSGNKEDTNAGECLYCNTANGYYLSKKKCCKQEYYWNTDSQQCQKMTFTQNVRHCAKIDDSNICTRCNNVSNFYKAITSPFICCLKGYYYDKTLSSCSKDFSQLSASLDKCNLFEYDQFNNLQCRAPSSLELSTNTAIKSCLTTTYYLVNKRCCENNYFLQISGQNCILISSDYSQYGNCQQLNDQNQCQKCKDENNQYISNGNCCTLNQYKPIDSTDNQCIAILWDNTCRKMIYNEVLRQYQCIHCASENNNEDFPQCCLGKYLPQGTTVCQNNLPNCSIMNGDGTCKTCSVNFYKSNGQCCQNGFYYQNGCTAIPTNLNCQQVSTSHNDNPQYCSLCNITTDQLQATDGKCCKKGYVFVKGHPLTNCIPFDNLFKNCLVFDSQVTKCIECDQGYDLSMGICCAKGQHSFLNSNNHYGCTYNYLENCLVQDSQTTCSECNTGYYLTNNNQTCCKIGHLFQNGQCGGEIKRENCTGFDNNSQCNSCISGYYISKDLNENSYCCQDGKYIKIFQGTPVCVSLWVLADDCNFWDLGDGIFECKECENGTYKTGPACCFDGDQFDIKTGECQSIQLTNCQKVSDDGKCTKCSNTNTHYISNDRCCPFGRYWDSQTEECLDNSRAWCKEYVDGSNTKCKTCLADFVPTYATTDSTTKQGVRMAATLYLIQEHCCNKTYYWDDSVSQCVKKIDNCVEYMDNKNQDGTNNNTLVQCSVCANGHVKSKDGLNCCKDYEFYNDETQKCVSFNTISVVYEGCIDWNEQNLLCQKCDPKEYYLSTSQNLLITLCCKFDHFVDNVTKKCALLSKVDYPKCTQFSSGNCTACEDGYALKASNHTCLKIMDFCTNFNPENLTCSACDKQHYLSNGICCGEKQFATDVNNVKQCVSSTNDLPQIDNCLQYAQNDNTKCSLCLEQYYLSFDKTKCVKDFMFWNGSSQVQGNIKFCEKYGQNADTCLRCVHSHSLMTVKANSNITIDQNLLTSSLRTFYTDNNTTTKHFCVRTELDLCLNSQFQTQDINSVDNKVQCLACKRNNYVQELQAGQEVVKIRQHYKIPNCKHQITHKLYSLSTFQCAECEEDFYLDKPNHLCVARTSKYTSNCLNRNLFADRCLQCTIRYSLVDGECIIPGSPCLLVNGQTQCQVCDDKISYTYFLDSEPLDQKCFLHTEFEGENLVHTPPDIFNGSIRHCEPHHQCTDNFLHNLNVETHKYLSCHICKESNRIPFISLSISNQGLINGVKRYSMWNQSDKNLTNFLKDKENKQSECFKIDFSEFKLPEAQNADLFPANCAVGAFNSDLPLNMAHSKKNNLDQDFDYTKATAICLECKPGYRATRNTFFQMVRSCEVIENCKLTGGTSFSQCEECQEGYYFKYNSSKLYGGIDKGYCYQSTENHDQHCYAFDDQNKKCHTCKNGYSKNHDGKCEQLSTAFCETNFNFNRIFAKEEYNLAYYRGEQGCTQCQEGYERIFRQENDFVCFSSSYQLNLPDTTKYVANCEFYHNQIIENAGKVLKCYKCSESFIITSNGTCITKVTEHENCLVAINETTCQTCSSGFYLINGLCKTGEVQNCNSYVLINEQLVCNTCEDYYFLNNDKICQKGEIQFCKVFSGLTSCVTCDANYQLVILKNNTHYCLSVENQTSDCQDNSLSTIEIANMNLKCNTCKPNTLLELITPKKVCTRINLIKNCIKYNRGSDFASSTLQCEKCQGHTFINDKGQCQDRKNTVPGCFQYWVNKDQCQQCQQNYFLDLTGLNCVTNPSGLMGCQTYSSKTICAKCFSDFYLENGKCVVLLAENKIPGCVAYNSQKQCVECELTTSLVDQKCEANSVTNCSLHETPISCKTCNVGFGISNIDNLNKCISLPSIPGCIQQSQFEPYLCDICEINQYLDDNGKCQPLDPTKQITNCIVYGADQLCQRCEKGYALSSNNTKCFKIHENINCQQSFETKSNFCDICLPGYKLDTNGNCVTTLAQEITGCFTSNYTKDDQCAICNFGFSMKVDFTCQSNQITDNGNTDNGNTGTDGNTGNDVEIMKMAMRLTFLLFFLF